MAADLKRFIVDIIAKETGSERVNVLGHSMGGKAAALFALHSETQSHVNKLIIEDIAPHRSSQSSEIIGFVKALQALDLSKPRSAILTDLEAVIPAPSIRQFLLTNLVLDPADSSKYVWKINLKGVENSIDHIFSFKVETGEFKNPTLFVYGGKTDHVSERDFEPIRALFPRVKFECIADAGHWVHADQPHKFIDIVNRFLSS